MRLWVTRGAAVLGLIVSASTGALADGLSKVGYGRLINNDFIGDLKDRQQTGSYVSSRLYARGPLSATPTRAGEVLELRLQGDIKTPDELLNPGAGDRPYAGSLTLGLHTHYETSGFEVAMGAEMVGVGPQFGLDVFQTALHDLLGVAAPSAALKSRQIGNSFYPGVVVEMGRAYSLSDRTTLRPFVEGRSGVETMIRAGFDLSLGAIGAEALQVRDGITGQRYRTVVQDHDGVAFVIGADMAVVKQSAYLPAARGYSLTNTRDRARMGMHWQGERGHGFFGATYLGKEFQAQSSAQVVGSIRLGLKF